MQSGEWVRGLIADGVDVNATVEKESKTALMAAAEMGHLESLRLLLQAGAQVNTKSDRDETALSLAARNAQFEVVKTLLEVGAKENEVAK